MEPRPRAQSIQPGFSVNAGREAFKRVASISADNSSDEFDIEMLRKEQEAIRAFTESVEMDFPPVPELPPSLDIDCYEHSYGGRMKESSTIETIIEVGKLRDDEKVDPRLGETQKYQMTVAGPEFVDTEIEMHKSLLKEGDDELDSEVMNIQSTSSAEPRSRPSSMNTDEKSEVREAYAQAALQRPRATTPTSWNVLDEYVKKQEEGQPKRRRLRDQPPPDAGARIRVSIPNYKTSGARERRNSMSWSDFYESMEQPKIRSRSSSRQGSVDFDFEQEWTRQNSVSARQRHDSWVEPNDRRLGNAMSTEQPSEPQAETAEAFMATEPSPFEERRESATKNVDTVSAEAPADTTKTEEAGESPKAEKSVSAASESPKDPDESKNQGGAVPVRAAPPPPPGKKKPADQVVPDATPAYNTSAYAGYDQNYGTSYGSDAYGQQYDANAYYGQGYDYSQYSGTYDANAAATYDQNSYNYGTDYPAASYDQTAAGYDQTAAYDPNAYNYGAYDSSQYYQGYDTTGYTQPEGSFTPTTYGAYDPTAYNAGYDQYGTQSTAVGEEQTTTAQAAAINAGYDQSGVESEPVGAEQTTTDVAKVYAAGYDQEGLRTSAVGADDGGTTDDSASGSQLDLTDDAKPSTNYDYSGYNYPEYGQEQSNVTVTTSVHPEGENGTAEGSYDYSQYNQYDGYDTAAYGATDAFDTSAYGTVVDPAAYNAETYEAPADPSQYGTEVAAYGTETSAYGGYDYSAYGSAAASTLQPFSQPLLPQAAPKSPDPFSWEAQESTGGLPPPRPPPARTPEPEREELSVDVENGQDKPAPPRPTPPAAGKTPPRPPPPPASPGQSHKPAMPPPPRPSATPSPKTEEPKVEEEDPWARFKQMSEAVGSVVKSTENKLKDLSETTAANEIKDETYVGQIGGTQQFELTLAQKKILKMEEEKKKAKADKKATKAVAKKKRDKVGFDPKKEEEMERKAAELVAKMAATRADLQGYKPPTDGSEASVRDEQQPEPEEEEESEEEAESPEVEKPVEETKPEESPVENGKEEAPPPPEPVIPEGWAAFSADGGKEFAATLPTSESDFFAQAATTTKADDAFGGAAETTADPFAPSAFSNNVFDTDPFDTRPIEEIMEEARRKAEEKGNDLEQSVAVVDGRLSSRASTPTEGASPVPDRPVGFEDEFKVDAAMYSHTPTPLYDEDDSAPLEDFIPQFAGEGWEMMVRHPLKKKNFMQERCWKPCFVTIEDKMLRIFSSRTDRTPLLEILLQATYSLSDSTLQAYDAYGKIHTVKLQHVLYKERVGIRAGQISRLVEGHITKYGLPLEHAAQVNVLAKFAALDSHVLETFINTIEDILFHCPAKRDTNPTYKQDEVQIHCHDEYGAHVDKLGNVSKQRARVRMFCLSFLTGSPFLEIGLNDRRREGKEIVRRKDILPMYTERWIRFEGMEFHSSVDQKEWDEEQVVKVTPPDACFFEILRFRIRPPKNREKPLSVKSVMKIAGSKIEIKIDVMAAAQQQRARGTVESARTIPCEDIQIRFPIPEAWIYIFREERTWGVGSVHSKNRRTGKMKNLKDRLIGSVQHTEPTLIEVATGEAKYEHVYRSLVWRIPRLPEKHHQAYKQHLLKCRFDLSSFDLMPEEFQPTCDVEFTMPLATISNTVVRSVSVEQHEDSDRVEKFVRYVAKCHYDMEIDYVQCNTLDDDTDVPLGYQAKEHEPMFKPDEIKNQHEGYKVEYTEEQLAQMRRDEEERRLNQPEPPITQESGATFNPFEASAPTNDFESYAVQGGGGTNGNGPPRQDSSSDEEDTGKFPTIKIDMQGYGYGY
ncbi:unnamed protein product [Bursaphelenchus xylophilus]|uniref:(pine wood nematode) hypothetical protein n=1 Tax=Bursaphelenchus xylophilus TaxID=6326 RepID=A0A1I7RMN2_BURXY|nr:unnamed protein product [Bursaphelenchus xylophilus]CAG9125649.1 unnamed protein product [Bursaphelenchus xylophilus]